MTVTIDSEASGARRGLTLGEHRVGLHFNPSGDEYVTKLKKLGAAFIDACEDLKIAVRRTCSPTTGKWRANGKMARGRADPVLIPNAVRNETIRE